MLGNSGMSVTGKVPNTHRNSCADVTLFKRVPPRTGLALNLGLRGETPTTKYLNYVTVFPVILHRIFWLLT
jgi:hypothetical protein